MKTLAGGITLSIILAAAASAQTARVVNPRATTDSSVDCSSAEAVVAQGERDGVSYFITGGAGSPEGEEHE